MVAVGVGIVVGIEGVVVVVVVILVVAESVEWYL